MRAHRPEGEWVSRKLPGVHAARKAEPTSRRPARAQSARLARNPVWTTLRSGTVEPESALDGSLGENGRERGGRRQEFEPGATLSPDPRSEEEPVRSPQRSIVTAAFLLLLAGASFGQVTQRVSVGSRGEQGNGSSGMYESVSISADGRFEGLNAEGRWLLPHRPEGEKVLREASRGSRSSQGRTHIQDTCASSLGRGTVSTAIFEVIVTPET
jgi:hypothetical protein